MSTADLAITVLAVENLAFLGAGTAVVLRVADRVHVWRPTKDERQTAQETADTPAQQLREVA